ncbi:MAG: T9SS type A sorting domain-containing protein [Bacteroidetes bacterium]|nr:T9SS type A sorting domain-containing protein [Bacteroidota bacterium]
MRKIYFHLIFITSLMCYTLSGFAQYLGGNYGGFSNNNNFPVTRTYATWNPLDQGAGITLSGGNLTTANTAAGMVRATIGVLSGKWYWEITRNNPAGVSGIANASAALTTYPGANVNGWEYDATGLKYTNAAGVAYGATYTTGDVIGVALDMDAGTITYYKNGVSQGIAYSGLTGIIYPASGAGAGGASPNDRKITANFGATAFAYAVPGGYNSGLYTDSYFSPCSAPAGINFYLGGSGGGFLSGERTQTVCTPPVGISIWNGGIGDGFATANNFPATPVYTTWNPSDKGAGITLSGGDLGALNTAAGLVRSTVGVSSGKWYWEVTKTDAPAGGSIGFAKSTAGINNYPGADANGWMYSGSNGYKYTGGVGVAYGAAYVQNDVIGIALDMDAGSVTFYVNGVSQGVAYSGLTGTIFASVGAGAAGKSWTTNFGATAFAYAVPSGFNSGLYSTDYLSTCTPPPGLSIFLGGQSDGFSSGERTQTVCTPPAGINFYVGGSADGAAQSENSRNANPPVPSVSGRCLKDTLTMPAAPAGIAYYWQGTTCGTNTALPTTSPYIVTDFSSLPTTYYVRTYDTNTGCFSRDCDSIVLIDVPPCPATSQFAINDRIYFLRDDDALPDGRDILSYITGYTTGSPVVKDLCTMPSTTLPINALAANPVDRFLYYVEWNTAGTASTIIRLDTNCYSTRLCTIPYAPYRATFDNFGRLWIATDNATNSTLVAYNPSTCAILKGPFIIPSIFASKDMAYNQNDGRIYFAYDGSVVSYDTLGVLGATYSPGFNGASTYGGFAFGVDGNLYGIENQTVSSNVLKFNMSTHTPGGVILSISPGTADPCGCDAASFLMGQSGLPVELLSFNAVCSEEKVKLQWSTATESNNDYYSIERSIDGVNFSVIGKVKGAGNSSITRQYTFTDPSAADGVSYYRLKQTDYDGKSSVSKTVSYNKSNCFMSLYPNPFDKTLYLSTGSGNSVNALIRIINVLGQEVYSQHIIIPGDNTIVAINLPALASGMYFVWINDTDNSTLLMGTKVVRAGVTE